MNYKLSNIDIATCLVSLPLFIFIFFPRSIVLSASLVNALLSPLGIVFLFSLSVSLFLFTNLPFACLFIVVIYEILRRYSGKHVDRSIQYSAQINRDAAMKEMNGPHTITLEEDTINQILPLQFLPSADTTVAAATSSSAYSSF
jgi:hypothetical protein